MQATEVKSTALHLPSAENQGQTCMGRPPATWLQFDPGFNWSFEGTLAWPVKVAYYLSILFYSHTYVGKKMFSLLCNNWGVQTAQHSVAAAWLQAGPKATAGPQGGLASQATSVAFTWLWLWLRVFGLATAPS